MNTTLHSLFWRCTNYPAMGTKLFWLLELAASLFFSSGNHSPTVLTQDMFTEIVFSLGFNPRFCSLCLSRLELQHQNDTLMQKISISVSEIHYCVLKRKETHIIPREKNIALNPRFLSCNYFDIFFFSNLGIKISPWYTDRLGFRYKARPITLVQYSSCGAVQYNLNPNRSQWLMDSKCAGLFFFF